MDSSFNNSNPYMSEQEDIDMGQENIAESPPSAIDSLIPSSTSAPKRRRGIEKRVVEIPIKDVEWFKGESNTPPSDSWAWRKYGQKPIKGSPYPRGYYRCSSSKGCPARKQVERSRADPTMLLVTYSSNHNHPSPPSRNNHNAATKSNKKPNPEVRNDRKPEPKREEKRFTDLGDESLINSTGELGWLGEMEAIATASSYAVLESPIFTGHEADVASMLLGEEEESLFADLGELPECSVVFRRRVLLGCACGTTG